MAEGPAHPRRAKAPGRNRESRSRFLPYGCTRNRGWVVRVKPRLHRRKAFSRRRIHKRAVVISCVLIAVAFVVTFMLIPAGQIAGAVAGAVAVAGAIADDYMQKQRGQLTTFEQSLETAVKEACTQILAWQKDPVIAAYCAKVVAERQFITAEVEAMRVWVEAAEQRKAVAEKQANVDEACRALYRTA